jgi:DNA sulfur modification protein DndD
MIFDEIVLKNFGVYKDRQQVVLAPPTPEQNVVLLGGLNGAGKTTFLDALQLALYGKMARCSNRSTLGYDEFLRRSVHWSADPKEGAALEVQFRHTTDGEEHTYRINRSWSAYGTAIRERVEVARDGTVDRTLTDSWDEYVESLIPLRISHLFFFDGEKIEGLADLENSAEVLSTAIHSLLGIDLVDKLATDLVVLERRKRIASKTDVERRQIEEAQEELKRIEMRYEELFMQRAGLQNELERREKRLHEVETNFRLRGGDLYERQSEVEAARGAAEKRLRDVEEELRDLAAGPAPLLLVSDLLKAVETQVEAELEADRAEVFAGLLEDRDAKVLADMRKAGAPAEVLKTLKKLLLDDRQKRGATTEIESYLKLESEAREVVRSLHSVILPDTKARAVKLLQLADEAQSTLVDHDRNLAGIPDQETLAHLIEEREKVRHELAETKVQLGVLDSELDRVKREREMKRLRLMYQIESNVDFELEQEDLARMIFHSQKTRKTLEKFRTAVTKHHVSRIERFILDSLRQLLRKDSLVSDLKIDPERFSVKLYGRNGKLLPPERLSAGERQLLAISILWGLARTSGQTLPAIIDTPLGRLDATHRAHLVQRYFPYASHQVLLLSTDEEIDEHYYDKLKPWVGRSYSFQFDDSIGATRVQQGYFW